jgi:hypothetical protein
MTFLTPFLINFNKIDKIEKIEQGGFCGFFVIKSIKMRFLLKN